MNMNKFDGDFYITVAYQIYYISSYFNVAGDVMWNQKQAMTFLNTNIVTCNWHVNNTKESLLFMKS